MQVRRSSKRWLKGRIFVSTCSIVYDVLYPVINMRLCSTYALEEERLKKKMLSLREKNEFKPCEYGQDEKLVGCTFKKSVETLRQLNTVSSPFEIVSVLQQTHISIAEEVEEYKKQNNISDVFINGDIILASLMGVFLDAQLEHPIRDMLYVQYFSFIDYRISESGTESLPNLIAYMVTNFIIVVENYRQLAAAPVLSLKVKEEPQSININEMIVTDFFSQKIKKMRLKNAAKIAISEPSVHDSRDNELSDRDTEESHGKIIKSPLSTK